jgi:hypothetical protein
VGLQAGGPGPLAMKPWVERYSIESGVSECSSQVARGARNIPC